MSRAQLFGSLCATVFLVNLARVVFAPLLQPVAADFGVTVASLGVLATAVWLGSALPRLPTGYILTRVPRHYVVIGTGTLLVFTSAFTGLAQTTTHLIAGAFLMGLSSGIYFIAANPLISELFPRRVGRVMGFHHMSSQLAAVAAPLIVGGILLVADWRTTFFTIAALAAVVTVLIVVASYRIELPDAGVEDRSLLVAGRAQWRLILTGIAVAGTIGFLWNGLFNLYGDYVELTKGIDPSTGRLLLSMMFAAGLPAALIGGRFAETRRNLPLIIAITMLFGTAVAGLTLVHSLLLVALLSLLIGFCFFAMIPVIDTYMLASLPDKHRGSAYTWYSATMMIFNALGSGTIGTIVARGLPYDTTFQGVSVVVVFIAIGMAVLYRLDRLPRRARSA